jgi:hypothetical protein
MKTTQYVKQEKAIALADTGGIRERWIWGLRLLRDPAAMSSPSSLRHGVAEQLVAAARAAGRKLSDREIRRRLQCARAYPTEAQIGRVLADFGSWYELSEAGFPAYEAPDGEPLADHRTDAERDHDHARALIDLIGEQGALFPLRDFEPVTTTLKELLDYTEQQEEMTARFVAHGEKRRAYLESLIRAAGNDLSVAWQEAHRRLVDTPVALDLFTA